MIYLNSITQLFELARLPVLFIHYQQHKIWDHEITFLEFIRLHYAESINENPDKDLDMKLPFKSHPYTTTLTFPATPLAQLDYFYFGSPSPGFSLEKQSFIYTQGQLTASFLSSIWQPPRFC